jgi:dihydropteroate synthase
MAVERGAHVVRTHDVAETRDAALIGEEFSRERSADADLGIEELDVTTDEEFSRHLDRIGAEVDGGRPSVVTRTVEFRLPERAAAVLEERANAAGLDAYRGESVLLVGTRAQFDRLRSSLEDADASVREPLNRVCEDIGGV